MKNLIYILIVLVASLPAFAAASAIDGEVFVAAGTSGTNALPSSRSTNVTIRTISNVSDGASAVAFSLTSSNLLSTDGARLFDLKNSTNELWHVDSNGTLVYGNSATRWGGDPGSSYLLLSYLRDDDATYLPSGVKRINMFTYNTNNDQSELLLESAVDESSLQIWAGIAPTNRHFLNMEVDALQGPRIEGSLGLDGSSSTVFLLRPFIAATSTPYVFNTEKVHTGGNLFGIQNKNTNKFTVDYLGEATAVEGFSSTASDAAVTIDATGWTNTFSKNAVVYMDSAAGITFTVYNNAGAAVYTNSTTATAVSSVLLQPSGKVIITAGTLGAGRATPF
jgi:hypothetical protein